MNPPPATRRRIITESRDFAEAFKKHVTDPLDIVIPMEMAMIIYGYLNQEKLEQCSMGICDKYLYLEECLWWLGGAYCRECYKYLEEHNFFSFSDSEEDEDDDLDVQ